MYLWVMCSGRHQAIAGLFTKEHKIRGVTGTPRPGDL